MATTGNVTTDATGITIEIPKGCTEFAVHCLSGATQKALVHIDGLHEGS